MKAQVRLALLEGRYICPVAYPQEYDFLNEQSEQQEAVDAWLAEIDMRLARVGADGAFFMAPRKIESRDIGRIRDDFTKFRDVYGPAVRMMDVIRNGKEEFSFEPGEFVQLAELEIAVNGSTTLEGQLRSFEIVGASKRHSNRELLKKLLENLAKDGYLRLVDASKELYRTTGKVGQLAAALEFMAERQGLAATETETELDQPGDLFQDLSPEEAQGSAHA